MPLVAGFWARPRMAAGPSTELVVVTCRGAWDGTFRRVRLTTEEIAEATGGEVFGRPTAVDGAGIDSRTLAEGQLFVPLVAERDGHDFIGAAISRGAPAYLTSGPIEAATAVRVEDTSLALTDLGRSARSRLSSPVVGITGSVGKTSLKDMLAAAGTVLGRVHVSEASFNNELGVPLTLLRAPDAVDLVAVEMGARGPGHIADLCEVARPTVGVVTRVAGAHLEMFGDLDGVARAKGELIEALPADGTAVLNADDPRVAAMASRTGAAVVTFGRKAGDVRAESVALDELLRPSFRLVSPWGSAQVRLSVAGEQQVVNALGAAAVVLSGGGAIDEVASALGRAQLSAMRMDVFVTDSGTRVIDDSYNANPESMSAALDALASLRADRRIAVLGTMAELGPDSQEHHRRVAERAGELGFEVLSVAETAYGSDGVLHVETADGAVTRLQSLRLGADDAVLVKASRSAALERIVAALR